MRKALLLLIALVMLAPALAEAQSRGKTKRVPARVVVVRRHDDCCWGNRFSFEPYAGALMDAFDDSPDGEDTGILLGFRVGYILSSRGRLVGNVGYSKSEDVANSAGLTDYFVYDNTWVFTSVGGEFDVVPGRTSVSLGLQVGAAFRSVDVDGTIGNPVGLPDDDDGFSAQELLLPSLLVRYRITNSATFMAGIQDYLVDFIEGPAQHSVALTAGIAFR